MRLPRLFPLPCLPAVLQASTLAAQLSAQLLATRKDAEAAQQAWEEAEQASLRSARLEAELATAQREQQQLSGKAADLVAQLEAAQREAAAAHAAVEEAAAQHRRSIELEQEVRLGWCKGARRMGPPASPGAQPCCLVLAAGA